MTVPAQSTADAVLQHLASYNLKTEPSNGSGNNYRCNSPLRPDSDSMGFTLKIADEEHGTWLDHVSDESGSLYELAEKLGIETPKSEAKSGKRGYGGIDDYAKAHGIPASALIEAGWEAETVIKDGRPALTFKTANGMRWRFLDGKIGGETPPYKAHINTNGAGMV